jgi:type IV pilus assembly protein PilM
MALFNFLSRKPSSVLGIDIGTTSIKAIEVRRGAQGQKPAITNYGMLESRGSVSRANMAFQTSTLKLFDKEAGNFLSLLLKRMQPTTTIAVASLPLFSAFTTVLSMPQMPDEELEKAVTFQARQAIPLPLSEVALDWSKVGEYKDDKGFTMYQILLISVPQVEIRKYQAIFSAAGLSLQSLEVESLSITRLLVGNDPTPTFIVDIGNRSTGILITVGGQIQYSAQTDFSGNSLTQALATSLGVNPARAEELKKERGVLGTGPNYELSTIMLPYLDAILSEVRRADNAYHTQFPSAPKCERVILTGGGANLLGIQKYFGDQLGIPAVKAAPFLKFQYPPLLEPIVPELNPLFSNALGLTLRNT